ncbi:hypothetical protein NDU88_006277 [Pleurodeles waltl]|uniref:Uncharacterized protein n=1 Tax=Pleurodeles waltl TaxID=8319 RepID=A0AAV7UKI7_PLEWA|nr:hypothetical protein NDU88_006277 [Pleurodeles waltl]
MLIAEVRGRIQSDKRGPSLSLSRGHHCAGPSGGRNAAQAVTAQPVMSLSGLLALTSPVNYQGGSSALCRRDSAPPPNNSLLRMPFQPVMPIRHSKDPPLLPAPFRLRNRPCFSIGV